MYALRIQTLHGLQTTGLEDAILAQSIPEYEPYYYEVLTLQRELHLNTKPSSLK
jgi:hypothetical protein